MPKPSVNPMLTDVSGILVTLPAAVGRDARPFDGMLSAVTRKVAHSIMDSHRVTIPWRKSGKSAREATSSRRFFTSHAWSIRRVDGAAGRRHGVWHCRVPRHRLCVRTIP